MTKNHGYPGLLTLLGLTVGLGAALCGVGCAEPDPGSMMDASTNQGTDSGTPNGGLAGACDFTSSTSFCVDYVGSSYTSTSTTGTCSTQSATYLAAGCPSTNLVGTCTVDFASDPALRVVYHYYSTGGTPLDGATAMSACTGQSGTFMAF